jgi:signal transduction histidine kinase
MALVLCLILSLSPSCTFAKSQSDSSAKEYADGALLDFQKGEIAFSDSMTPPTSGWEYRQIARVSFIQEAYRRVPSHKRVFWARFRFPREALGNGPQAFGTDHTSDRFILYLNGIDVYRTFEKEDDRQFNWNRPRMALLPTRLLRPGINEILVRVDTGVNYNLRLGAARIGPLSVIQASYDWRYLVRVEGPRTINGVLLVLTIGVVLFWLVRRKEREFGWLAFVGVAWMFRNLHYYIAAAPFEPELFWELTVHSMFVLMVALYGFTATFLDIPNRNRNIMGFIIAGLFIALLRFIEVQQALTDILSYLLSIPLAGLVLWVLLKHVMSKPRVDGILMLSALTISITVSIHDLGLMIQWWVGTTYYLQPYSSILVYSAFAFTLGRRVLLALDTVENMNSVLEDRVALAAAKLTSSEAARRELEISQALIQERERLMMEIHDGIGSNLITALSTAEQTHAAPGTIAILRQAITDLKIAVDSLEAIEGDVVSLIASLRHRLEPDLNRAGITFDWRVQDAPVLPWLDAVGALHILRILQEAISNILVHSCAKQIVVECRPAMLHAKDGVEICLFDEGRGFDSTVPTLGKGIANMATRASSLHGKLTCESAIGKGTRVRLWLPVLPILVDFSEPYAP